jgi:hypothetical protein
MNRTILAILASVLLAPSLAFPGDREVAPETIDAVIRVESGGNPLAVNVNGLPRSLRVPKPSNLDEAAQIAEAFIEAGYTVDMGLMQINSRNLGPLGLSVRSVFDPHINMRAGCSILAGNYDRAVGRFGPGQQALLAALSAYNTGNFSDGFRNGYIRRYFSGRPSPEPSRPMPTSLSGESCPSAESTGFPLSAVQSSSSATAGTNGSAATQIFEHRPIRLVRTITPEGAETYVKLDVAAIPRTESESIAISGAGGGPAKETRPQPVRLTRSINPYSAETRIDLERREPDGN